jgi:hypothetical protein
MPWSKTANIQGPQGPPGLNWTGAWAAATAYAVDDAVTYAGSSYRRKVAGTSAGAPDTDTTNWELLAAKGLDGGSLRWLGTWSSATAYVVNDAVERNGSSYACLVANTNKPPEANATEWQLIAQAGAPGPSAVSADTTPNGANVLTIGSDSLIYLGADTTAFTKYLTIAAAGTTYLPLAGGTLTGDLVLPAGNPATANSATNKTYVDNAITAVTVPPATVPPLMDGTAAVGTVAKYAKEDHVHPTDTSLLSKAGGTMTGPIVLAADPAANLQAATKQYVDGAVVPPATNPPPMDGTAAVGTVAKYAKEDHIHPSDTSKLSLSGGTMTGSLILAADPTAGSGAATKAYVDAAILAIPPSGISADANQALTLGSDSLAFLDDRTYLPVAGGTMTGLLTLSGPPTANLHAATKAYVDGLVVAPGTANPLMDGTVAVGVATVYSREDHVHPSDTSKLSLSGGTMTGDINMGGFGIDNMASPTSPSGAATKQYVDLAVSTGNLWQGTYEVAANDPDLSAISPLNAGYSWTAVTADPNIPEALVPNLPGLPAGTMIGNGDILKYDGTNWNLIPGSGMTKTEADGLYLKIAGGDTMTGLFALSGNATGNLNPVPLQQLNTALAAYLPLVGGTLTGDLILAGDPSVGSGAATKSYVDTALASGNFIIKDVNNQSTGNTFLGDVGPNQGFNWNPGNGFYIYNTTGGPAGGCSLTAQGYQLYINVGNAANTNRANVALDTVSLIWNQRDPGPNKWVGFRAIWPSQDIQIQPSGGTMAGRIVDLTSLAYAQLGGAGTAKLVPDQPAAPTAGNAWARDGAGAWVEVAITGPAGVRGSQWYVGNLAPGNPGFVPPAGVLAGDQYMLNADDGAYGKLGDVFTFS